MRISFILIGLSLLSGIPAKADDLMTRPWLAKVIVGRTDNGNDCDRGATSAYERLAKAENAVIFGWPAPSFSVSEKSCSATILFASKEPLEPVVFEAAFREVGLAVSHVIDNRNSSFMGFTAVKNSSDGKFEYCERRESRLSIFSSWIEGYSFLSEEAAKTSRLDRDSKLRWINAEFSCPDISNASSVDIVFDLTNAEICPLDMNTFRSCFIARGFQKYRLDLGKH